MESKELYELFGEPSQNKNPRNFREKINLMSAKEIILTLLKGINDKYAMQYFLELPEKPKSDSFEAQRYYGRLKSNWFKDMVFFKGFENAILEHLCKGDLKEYNRLAFIYRFPTLPDGNLPYLTIGNLNEGIKKFEDYANTL